MNQAVVNNLDKLSLQKLILLGIGSILLCLSLLMSVFTPYPLILAIVLFGRVKGYALATICWILVFIAGALLFKDLFFFSFYTFCFITAVGIGEIILRKLSPVKWMVILGLAINAAVLGTVGIISLSSGMSVKNLIVQEIKKNEAVLEQMKQRVEETGSISQESIEVLSVLENPELMAQQMLETAPSYLFLGVFFLLWVNMFLILNAKNYLGESLSKYNEQVLIKFKMPEHFIWVVIASLVMAIWGSDLGASWLEPIGLTLIKCLGIFYFFQGFGIYLDFLSFAKIRGFFRTFLIVITVFSANQIVAILGLFDMFINFRRFFNKK